LGLWRLRFLLRRLLGLALSPIDVNDLPVAAPFRLAPLRLRLHPLVIGQDSVMYAHLPILNSIALDFRLQAVGREGDGLWLASVALLSRHLRTKMDGSVDINRLVWHVRLDHPVQARVRKLDRALARPRGDSVGQAREFLRPFELPPKTGGVGSRRVSAIIESIRRLVGVVAQVPQVSDHRRAADAVEVSSKVVGCRQVFACGLAGGLIHVHCSFDL
jgi:hypothetical protein